MQYYIRFGDIPINERSCEWNGDEIVSVLDGVSVYPAIIDGDGRVSIGITLPVTRTTLDTLTHLLAYDNRDCLLVEGDYVGRGTDNEPLIKNIHIVGTLNYR